MRVGLTLIRIRPSRRRQSRSASDNPLSKLQCCEAAIRLGNLVRRLSAFGCSRQQGLISIHGQMEGASVDDQVIDVALQP